MINLKTYYALTVDFTAPTDHRLVTYSLSDRDVRKFYEKKTVPFFYDRFYRLFRRYGTYRIFIKNLDATPILIYNEPNVRMAIICQTEEIMQNLLKTLDLSR